jgi:hypothetical protein
MTSDSEPQTGASGASPTAQPEAPRRRERYNDLLFSFVTLLLIAFGVWVVLGGKRYRAEYAQATQGWRVGTTRSVEITLVRDDKTNLACASDHSVAGLRCGYGRDQKPVSSLTADKPEMLQPYSTLGGELLLGAGLWTAADMRQTLPETRFSVVCNYNIKGVMKSASIRFSPTGRFNPTGKTVTVGSLNDCVVPR